MIICFANLAEQNQTANQDFQSIILDTKRGWELIGKTLQARLGRRDGNMAGMKITASWVKTQGAG